MHWLNFFVLNNSKESMIWADKWGTPALRYWTLTWECLRSCRREPCLTLRLKAARCCILQPWSSKYVPQGMIALALLDTYFIFKTQWMVRLDQSAFWSAGPPGALLLAAASETEPTQVSLWCDSGSPFLGARHRTKRIHKSQQSCMEWQLAKAMNDGALLLGCSKMWETESWAMVIQRLKEELTHSLPHHCFGQRAVQWKKEWHQLHEPSNSFRCAGGVLHMC